MKKQRVGFLKAAVRTPVPMRSSLLLQDLGASMVSQVPTISRTSNSLACDTLPQRKTLQPINPDSPSVANSDSNKVPKCLHHESLPQPSTSHSYIPHPLGPKAVRTSLHIRTFLRLITVLMPRIGTFGRSPNVGLRQECRPQQQRFEGSSTASLGTAPT